MRAAFAVVFCFPLFLAGCSLSDTAAPTPDAGLAIRGVVHGGQQPIHNAHVYLFAAGAGAYAGPGIAASPANASASLLNAAYTGRSDSLGAYVLTDPGGNFSISGDYTCTPGAQVYLYSLGGDPGAGTNTAASLMAVLGKCPSSGNFASAAPYVVVNEVSTVAAAYSLAGFATDSTHISSSGSALALTGIQNAFANAANLASLSTGGALATTPAGNGTAPQTTVETLANILAACINSDGTISGPTDPTACYTLFANATVDGTITGAQQADTATAAIYIAHNPAANVANLYNLPAPSSPFGSGLGSQPNDFTLGLQLTSPDINAPHSVAIDGSGNAWVANNGGNSVTEFSSSSAVASGTTGFTQGGLLLPDDIAIDPSGNVWVTNYYGDDVTELNSSGTAYTDSPYSGSGLKTPYGIAADGSGNVWVTDYSTNKVTELNSSGTPTTYSSLSLTIPYAVAIDNSGNVWVVGKNNSAVTVLSSTGSSVYTGYTDGGLDSPYGIAVDSSNHAWIADYGGIGNSAISELSLTTSPASISDAGTSPFMENGPDGPEAIAIDGAGNAWIANNSSSTVTEFSSSGVELSGANDYTGSGTINGPDAVAVDLSGNVWLANNGNSTVTELIGAATPVVTPISAGVQNKTLGSRP